MLLLRDVTELRRRDRLLLSKDATIREIHHRVKNNLQTISSLLRLQGRRLSSPEAKAAIEESVRRIRSIALVHETLSREAGDDVAFVEIVRPLVRMVEESAAVTRAAGALPGRGRRRQAARPARHAARGRAQRAAAERRRPRLPRPATRPRQRAWSLLANDDHQLHRARSSTTASACPTASRSTRPPGLGLSIVRTLVTTELAGEITIRAGTPADHQRASLQPPDQGTGTTVLVDVPMRLEV